MSDHSMLTSEDIGRFWTHVEKTDTCWNWIGSITRGYGQICLRKNKVQTKYRAHRVSYWISNGDIPEGLFIDHICLNRACVRPDHLRLVTARQNNENLSGAQKRNASGFRGVTWHSETRRWRARVVHGGTEYFLGEFNDPEEAGLAARAKRLELQTHNELDRNGSWKPTMRVSLRPDGHR